MRQNEIISSLSLEDWKRVRNKYHIPNKGMNVEKAAKVLFEVDDLLRENDIYYFLSCGTALGFYRDGGFIPWDDEIDIDIFSEIFVPRLQEIKDLFINAGYVARATYRGKTSKMSIFKDGIKVAFGAIYDNESGYRCDLKQKFPSKFFDNPEDFLFNGRLFKMPGPLNEYLTFIYGDWKTPIKSYDINEYLNKDQQWRK
tara:strand:+ start:568 stop:1164 length:597 start_codon:yes stop_codon:yes gene_type:complete